MSNEDAARLRSLIYLYFDAAETKLHNRLNNITERILLNTRKISYDDALVILQIKDKIEIIEQIEKELYHLIDGLDDP